MTKGIIITYVLVFGAIFLLLLSGLLGFVLLQLRQSNQQVAWNEALHLAEAGANYYRWCLNHEVGDQCSTEKDYFGPQGNLIGRFSLVINSTVSCGENIKKEILIVENKLLNLQILFNSFLSPFNALDIS